MHDLILVFSAMFLCATTLLGGAAAAAGPSHDARPAGLPAGQDPGTLTVLTRGGQPAKTPDGEPLRLPLEHTDVEIAIDGFVARATVRQRYGNPFQEPIEAVYAFPLPNRAAVDGMTMRIGDKTIRGRIERREEARRIYEEARAAGQRTGLLEQERPNIFTQSVGNILPGDRIEVEIAYVEILDYRDDGAFELVFPMVVGPRYIPGEPGEPGETGGSPRGGGRSPDTDRVPDASRITPPVLRPGERSGHDIAVRVVLDAGLPIRALHSPSHAVDIERPSAARAQVALHATDRIPNKDLVLRWRSAGEAPQFALLTHFDAQRGGFFTLMALPQLKPSDSETVPRDLIFIVDTSGSMHGRPMDQSKALMNRLIEGMREGDRFNIVRFAGDSARLWPSPQPKTGANLRTARAFVDAMRGAGGTEMRNAILDALSDPAETGRLRIALLLTDGYVGNEEQIVAAIERERRGARVFALGVGTAPNRFLLERAALVGRGDVFSVRPDEDPAPTIERFFKRVDRPTLTDLAVDWGQIRVSDLTPAAIPDLWADQPLLLHGRYRRGGTTELRITGRFGGKPYELKLPATLPDAPSSSPLTGPADSPLMATVWARARVRELMTLDLGRGRSDETVERITRLGLDYAILTQWTAFVAVEETIVNQGGRQRTVQQPVELPELTDPEGFGNLYAERALAAPPVAVPGMPPMPVAPPPPMGQGMKEARPRSQPSFDMPPLVTRKAEPEDAIRDLGKTAPAKPAAAERAPGACRHRDLSVSGGLRYPDVERQLAQALKPICDWLSGALPAARAGSLGVELVLDGAGKVRAVRLKTEGARPPLDEAVSTELRQRLRRLAFGAVPGGGEVHIAFDLVLGGAPGSPG